MSLKKISKEQPSDFEFSKKNLEEAKKNNKKISRRKTTKCSYAFTLFSSKTE